MYDELIKRLRASCESCKLWDGYKCCLKGDCSAQKSLQAADAIEELEKQLREEKVDNVNLTGWLAEEHAKHLWISVTERLPEEYTWVLVSAKKHKVAFDAFYDGDQWKDAVLNGLVVTHWMPLPQVPESEGE